MTKEADFIEALGLLKGHVRDADHAQPILDKLYRLRPRGVRLSVCTAVLSDGKLLAVTRKEDGHLPIAERRTCLPGGFVEPDDYEFLMGFTHQTERMLKRAALRELREETGIVESDAAMSFCALDDVGTYCTLFRIQVHKDVPLVPEPGTECLWMTLNEFMARCAFPKFYEVAQEWGALS